MNSESRKGTAEMAEFSTGLQTWQEERYVGGRFNIRRGSLVLAGHPISAKK